MLRFIKHGLLNQKFRPAIKVESRQVSGGRLLNGFLLVRRELRLQLVGNGLGDFALDGEDVIKWTIVMLRPQVRVGARIDQLRTHAHSTAPPLHASFQNMSHTELLSNLA